MRTRSRVSLVVCSILVGVTFAACKSSTDLSPTNVFTDVTGGAGGAAAGGHVGQKGGGSAQGGNRSGTAGMGGASGPNDDPLCHATPRAADAPRKVVVTYTRAVTDTSQKAFRLLDLSPAGKLSATSATVDIGQVTLLTNIELTPDGQLGFAVIDDEVNHLKIAVFRITGDAIDVVDPGFDVGNLTGISHLTVDPTGARLWAVDSNRLGFVASFRIGCDGHLSADAEPLAVTLPQSLAFVPGRPGLALISQSEGPALSNPKSPESPSSASLLDTSNPTPTLVTSTQMFADAVGAMAGLALMPDGKFAISADNSLATTGNPGTGLAFNDRLSVIAIGQNTVTRAGLLQWVPKGMSKPFQITTDIVASPFNNGALVSAGYGGSDALWVITYDPKNTASPFSIAGELAYVKSAGMPVTPAIPGLMVEIKRGMLEGLVLVPEVDGIRSVRFKANGPPEDLGLFPLSVPKDYVNGAIGVQPLAC